MAFDSFGNVPAVAVLPGGFSSVGGFKSSVGFIGGPSFDLN